jgi:hypothetical protein
VRERADAGVARATGKESANETCVRSIFRARSLLRAHSTRAFGLVDGDHYFDPIAEKAIFEFRYASWLQMSSARTV